LIFKKCLVTYEELPSLLNLLLCSIIQIIDPEEAEEIYRRLKSERAALGALLAGSQAYYRPLLQSFNFIFDLLYF
tara:strand:- start:386 stop:610 length:225 start_codon:yes stop_codon:yes gene_type:complete